MKRKVSLVFGMLVLILGIIGYTRYFKDYPIKFGGIKLGGGKKSDRTPTLNGDYLLCSGSEYGLTESVYMEFKDGKINEVAIGKISYQYNDELRKKYTKEEFEKEMLKEFCTTEKEYYYNSGKLYNCNIYWNNNNIETIGNTSIPSDYRGLSKEEAKIKMEESNTSIKCTNETKAPKTSVASALSSTIIKKDNTSVDSTSNEETESTKANRHMQFCLDWNASGGSDVSMSYAFYCDKNIVQKSVDVSISANFNEHTLFGKNSGNYTTEDAEKEFRTRYCNKIKDCKISWNKNKSTIFLKGTCKTNYAGLSKSTVEEFRSGWEITTAFNEICE